MAKRTLNLADITQMMSAGAQIKVDREPAGPQEIVIKGLVEQLEAIGKKRDDELAQAVLALAKSIQSSDAPSPADMTLLIEALKPVPYEFDIDRNNRGQISKVLAMPLEG